MSCNSDPTARAFTRRIAQHYGLPTPRLEHRETDVHDIASVRGQNVILLGRGYRASSPRLQRQKLLHELHHFLGMDHNATARKLGYYSRPERDRWSRQRLEELDAR